MELSAQLEQKLTCKVELMYFFQSYFERASNQLDGHNIYLYDIHTRLEGKTSEFNTV